jgi:hypothetical protein
MRPYDWNSDGAFKALPPLDRAQLRLMGLLFDAISRIGPRDADGLRQVAVDDHRSRYQDKQLRYFGDVWAALDHLEALGLIRAHAQYPSQYVLNVEPDAPRRSWLGPDDQERTVDA